MKINEIKPNPNNPRLIKDDKFIKLVQSIKDFPEMMEKRPIVCVTDVDGKIYPLGGNMRFKALKEIGYKDIPENWVTMADDWTEEKRREFVIKDNVGFGEWDWEQLANDWDTDQLEEWGLDVPSFGSEESEEKEQKDLSDELKETFEVIITCGNETEQEATFEYLTKKGYICRVLTL
jgi:ParB-like chromosome segregation protein Spo0J